MALHGPILPKIIVGVREHKVLIGKSRGATAAVLSLRHWSVTGPEA
jgi:hypothetical protein